MARAPTGKGMVRISNVAPTITLMKKYGSGFSKMVRDDVQTNVTPFVVRKVGAAASVSSAQGRAVAGTFRTARDRFPAVRGFGATRVTSSAVAAGSIGFGANWGGGNRVRTYERPRGSGLTTTRHVTRQFGPWAGGRDHFIYSSIARNQQTIEDMWQDALDRAYVEWNR